MFNYEILKSFNDMEMLVYDYIMKNKNVPIALKRQNNPTDAVTSRRERTQKLITPISTLFS